jgi:RES domain-containing protein
MYDFSRAGLVADNRWNSQGDPTLYLARNQGVALAEWARHLREERAPLLAQYAKKRTVYRFTVELQHTLDLRRPEVWRALSLAQAPQCFLDKLVARAIADFIRRTTPAEAVFVPSMAFLDQLDQWVLVVFLEKISGDIHRFLPSVEQDGSFAVT